MSVLGAMACGSKATAHDAAAIAKTPVTRAAAGRSHPIHPDRPGCGSSCLPAAAAARFSQAMTGQAAGHAAGGRAVRAEAGLARILARILSRPSAAGSTDSAASHSARRSACSS
ncbi:MAG TPA: hypothetical protein VLX31_15395 [Streptosporangiaceae bacterium]|nr:hypothetical protein [Streptosporangiaceae bacterium]